MAFTAKPPVEHEITVELVLALLWEQHRDLAELPLADAGEGWNNHLFRLGETLAVRMPRRAASVPLIQQEQRWLPELSRRLPLPIPAPVRTGRAGCGYPWTWSVVPWLTGESALFAPWEPMQLAVTLGHFLHHLHQPAPDDAPFNHWRGIPLRARDQIFGNQLQQLEGILDRETACRLWERAISAHQWPGPPLWIHGDLHPGNLLVTHGCLTSVIDFGDLTSGDPATDLAAIWTLLPPEAHAAFWDAARGPWNSCDEHTQMRARGWALALGMTWLANSGTDQAMSAVGSAAISAALRPERLV